MVLKAPGTGIFCVTIVLIVGLFLIIGPAVTLSGDPGEAAASEHQETQEKKHHILVDLFNEYKAGEEPPSLTDPTLIHIGLYVAEITKIEPKDNTFTIEGYLDLRWQDERLTHMGVMTGHPAHFMEHAAEKVVEHIWWPDVTFTNGVGREVIENQELIVKSDGTVEYKQKFQQRLEVNFDLTKFPFDKQKLVVEIESFSWPSKLVKFVKWDTKTGFSTKYEIPAWHTEDMKVSVEDVEEEREHKSFSQFKATIEVERNTQYYLWKIMLPLIVIMTISWCVFWVDHENIGNRMEILLAVLLTWVAYQFIISQDLPKLGYLTYLDYLFLLSFFFITSVFVQAVIVYVLLTRGGQSKERAERINNHCKWAYPTAYFLIMTGFSVLYLA
jgi:hypothetical protein